MKVLILEPYMTDSHRAWAEGLKAHSRHEIEILSLPGIQWKWRMHGATVHFANLLKKNTPPNLIIASEMLDLATFKGLLPDTWSRVPAILYFHENQLTYPWSANDPDPSSGRDLHYAWIHITGCMAAEEVWFNSAFHQQAFLSAADQFICQLPGPLPDKMIDSIHEKSQVMPIGIENLDADTRHDRSVMDSHVLLWNHRWEYDKGPNAFFTALYELQDAGIPFRLVVLGKEKKGSRKVFDEAKSRLADKILHWGYAESPEEYWSWLMKSTILPVTSRHDFFGLSVLEAVAAGVQPLLPKRLSYPELFGADNACFYEQEEELVPRLNKMIAQTWRENKTLTNLARQFIWEKVIKQYDDSISKMM